MISTISKEQSNSILYSILALLKIGHSLPFCIEVLLQVEKGSLKKRYERIHYSIVKQDIPISQALAKEGILKNLEIVILDNSLNSIDAINSILEIRELSTNFEKTVLKLFTFPCIAFVIGLLIVYIAQPIFYDMVTTLVQQVEISRGIKLGDEASLMWYLEDRQLVLNIIKIYIFFIVFLIILYFYLREYYPDIIYKLIPLKSLDDIPLILMLMNNLQKSGLAQDRILRTLKEQSPKKGWIRLFSALLEENLHGNTIYNIFQGYGFPKNITAILKSSEISKTFWDNMYKLVRYIIEINLSRHKMINKTFGFMSTVCGFLIILYFLMGLFMAMFKLQSISMSIM
jgi:hypothetical protein